MSTNRPIDVGVIGAGSMGRHHARVYRELPAANLVGVTDVDEARAEEIATEHGTQALSRDELLSAVDAVSIAVPTEWHYDIAMECLNEQVGMLIEKPVVGDLGRAEQLQRRVDRSDVVVQVGHIERFNPAVMKLGEIIDELSVLSLRAQRLGPPPERYIADSAVIDLMIHDLDVVLSLVDETPSEVQASGVADNTHASALLEFENGMMASLTASRKTQRKVRTLEVIAEECFVEVDYLDQTIEIHRDSVPEYIEENGGVRFVHESVIEQPRVETTEPLRNELESFVRTVEQHGIPEVTLQDGIDALSLAEQVEEMALPESEQVVIGDD